MLRERNLINSGTSCYQSDSLSTMHYRQGIHFTRHSSLPHIYSSIDPLNLAICHLPPPPPPPPPPQELCVQPLPTLTMGRWFTWYMMAMFLALWQTTPAMLAIHYLETLAGSVSVQVWRWCGLGRPPLVNVSACGLLVIAMHGACNKQNSLDSYTMGHGACINARW